MDGEPVTPAELRILSDEMRGDPPPGEILRLRAAACRAADRIEELERERDLMREALRRTPEWVSLTGRAYFCGNCGVNRGLPHLETCLRQRALGLTPEKKKEDA